MGWTLFPNVFALGIVFIEVYCPTRYDVRGSTVRTEAPERSDGAIRAIPLAREGVIFVVPALLLSLLFLAFNLYIISGFFFLLLLFFAYFFRNPQRVTVSAEIELIAPADGRVTSVEDVLEDEFLGRTARRISIFMGPFDVHMNRAPCGGIVERIRHKDGRYGFAFKKGADRENERNYILLRRGDEEFLLVQIAGFVARRIICYMKEGDQVKKGDVIGMIAFGSRFDLYMPPHYEALVRTGQKVKGGLTPIARKIV
jgi:phosphatidylserine decarboxylase